MENYRRSKLRWAPFRIHTARILLLVSTICVAASSVCAQSIPASGTLVGRVKDASTGKYLENARLTIDGIARDFFTGELGDYRIANLPAGKVVLRAFYTGLDPHAVSLTLTSGQVLQQDIALIPVRAKDGDTIKLGDFVVTANKAESAAALAINEQRFAGNVREVVSTDAFGDVFQQNVGEFLKMLPGIEPVYNQMSVNGIMVRGFPAEYTSFTMDGMELSTSTTSNTRAANLQSISLNNASRIEVTKVPSPDQPATNLSGRINMVSKSAFELSRPLLTTKVFLTQNTHYGNINPFKETPGGKRGNDQADSSKVGKNFEFNYTNPVSKKFGFSINAASSDIFSSNNISGRSFDTRGTNANGKTSSSANPYLTYLQWNNFWAYESRYSAGLNLDFKLAPQDTLSLIYSWAYFTSNYQQHIFRIRPHASGTAAPLDWGPNFTHERPGVGDVLSQFVPNQLSNRSDTYRAIYRHRGALWYFDAVAGVNGAKMWNRNLEEGIFRGVSGTLGGLAINMDGFDSVHPGSVTATNAAGQSVNVYDALRDAPIAMGDSNYIDNTNHRYALNVSATRRFAFESYYGSFKLGADLSENTRRQFGISRVFSYLGPDGKASSGDETLRQAPTDLINYAAYTYRSPFDNPKPTFASSSKLYALYQAHPEYFAQDLVLNERNNLRSPTLVQDRLLAPYLMVDLRLMKNRLRVVTGVRYERERIFGQAALIDSSSQYQKDAAGNLLRDALGKLIPIYAGTLTVQQQIERERLVNKRLGAHFNESEGDYYPSLNASYNLTENIVARFGYAKVIGRPNYSQVVGSTTVTDLAEAAVGTVYLNNAPGLIQTVNPSLKPWKADAYDIRLEYYTKHGGQFSAGVWRRQVRGFFANRAFNADAGFLQEIGLSGEYVDYEVRSTYNLPESVQISGFEANVNQSLASFGELGRSFRVFGSVTTVRTIGPREANFRGFTPLIVNSGIAFNHKRLSVMIKQNLLGHKRTTAGAINAPFFATAAELNGKEGYWLYNKASLTFDANATYRLTDRYSLFANGRNIFNDRTVTQAYTDGNPDYVKDSGVQEQGVTFLVGIKGEF